MEITDYAREKLTMAEHALGRLESGTHFPAEDWAQLAYFAKVVAAEANKWVRYHDGEDA